MQLDRGEFEKALPTIVGCLEEPIASSSIVPMYFVCQRAREDVKVALIGQGPDELFCGYKRHLGIHYGDTWRKLPSRVRQVIGSAVNRLPRNETAKRGIYALGIEDRLERYEHVFSLAPAERIAGLFRGGPPQESLAPFEPWRALLRESENLDELGRFQHIEIRSSLPDELLMFADKLSMAHGLEVRVPVPGSHRRRVRRASERRHEDPPTARQVAAPPGVRAIPARAASQPQETRLRGQCRRSMVPVVGEQHLDGPASRSAARSCSSCWIPSRCSQLLEEHRSGQDDNHKLLFSLAMFEQWLRGVRAVYLANASRRDA